MRGRLLCATAVVVLALLPRHSGAQDLGSAYQKAREYVREMKENTSSSSSTRSNSSESRAPRGDSGSSARGAAREAERMRREQERAETQRERQRIENNLVRLDEWLTDAASAVPAPPPAPPPAPSPAAIAERRHQLDAALITANRSEYVVESSRATIAGASVSNQIRIARGVQIRDAIVRNAPVKIEVRPSNAAAYPNPWYADPEQEMVTRFDGWVRDATRGSSVDPDLVRAIIWMESTHGWYDRFSRSPSTILPMNVHASFWRDLGVSRSDLRTPELNIKTGVRLLEVLWRSVDQPSIEKVATIYNDLGREAVSGYGKTVSHYYLAKPWLAGR